MGKEAWWARRPGVHGGLVGTVGSGLLCVVRVEGLTCTRQSEPRFLRAFALFGDTVASHPPHVQS